MQLADGLRNTCRNRFAQSFFANRADPDGLRMKMAGIDEYFLTLRKELEALTDE